MADAVQITEGIPLLNTAHQVVRAKKKWLYGKTNLNWAQPLLQRSATWRHTQ